MRSWQLAPSYLADAFIKSFVRLSIPQPHSLIGQLLQSARCKTRLRNPIPSLASRLDPGVCLLMMSYPQVLLYEMAHML
jgi:hypothetical protein